MSFTSIPLAGQTLTAATLSALVTEVRPTTVRKTVDEIVSNSSTLQDDDALQLSVSANTTYEGLAVVIYEAGTAADIKFAWAFPSGTLDYTALGLDSGLTLVETVVQAASGTSRTFGGAAIGANRYVEYTFRLAVSSSAGTFKLQWAQNAATVENTAVKAGSWLTLKQTV